MRLYRLIQIREGQEYNSFIEVQHDKENNELLLNVITEEDFDDPIPFRICKDEIEDFIGFLTETKEAIQLQNVAELGGES